ncbi:MAG: PhzF family phenazine biosynthesis protein [Cyanobacteria bacterium P01_A01_bin.17]
MTSGSLPLSLYWVDAFTRTPFMGNPAVVVPEADALDDMQMQQIAREVNCSETAFVMPARRPETDFRLRWFTPTQEVDLCGHATIATLHTLAELGRFNLRPQTNQILYLETRTGVLAVTIDYFTAVPWVWLTLPLCDFRAVDPEVAAHLAQILGISGQPQPLVDSLNQDVLIAVETLQELHQLTPDLRQLAQLGRQHHWRGICVYTTETVDPLHAAHSRFFAPQSGIDEDPVTGSANGPLALHLSQTGTQDASVIMEQGDCLQRPGRIKVQLDKDSLKLGGQAVTVMRGEMRV